MCEKLREVHYKLRHPGRWRKRKSWGFARHGKGVLMANGKPEGMKQGDAWSEMHTCLPTSALRQTNQPAGHQRIPLRQAVLGSHHHDARDTNQVSTLRDNIPPQPHPGVLHDSIGKLGETLVLPTWGNQYRKVANGHLHCF